MKNSRKVYTDFRSVDDYTIRRKTVRILAGPGELLVLRDRQRGIASL